MFYHKALEILRAGLLKRSVNYGKLSHTFANLILNCLK